MRAHQVAESAGSRAAAYRKSPRLRIDQRCRVDGVMHAYLGCARLDGELLHVFARCEWRPDTPDQQAVSLVRDTDLGAAVVPLRGSLIG